MSLTIGSKFSNTEPRVKDRPTKAERKLAKRIEAWEQGIKSDANMKAGGPDAYHKPGSQKK